MTYNELIMIAAIAPFVGGCIGHFMGKRSEAAYWADHADNGDVHHRGTFYRITKKIGQRGPQPRVSPDV